MPKDYGHWEEMAEHIVTHSTVITPEEVGVLLEEATSPIVSWYKGDERRRALEAKRVARERLTQLAKDSGCDMQGQDEPHGVKSEMSGIPGVSYSKDRDFQEEARERREQMSQGMQGMSGMQHMGGMSSMPSMTYEQMLPMAEQMKANNPWAADAINRCLDHMKAHDEFAESSHQELMNMMREQSHQHGSY